MAHSAGRVYVLAEDCESLHGDASGAPGSVAGLARVDNAGSLGALDLVGEGDRSAVGTVATGDAATARTELGGDVDALPSPDTR